MKTAYAFVFGMVCMEYENETLKKLICRPEIRSVTGEELEGRTAFSDEVMGQVQEFLEGRRRHFDLETVPEGTAFQKKVWQALLEIPYGETRTYRQIAEAIGSPRSCRAVGMANNKNPLHLIIPCHRVIGSDGKLTGYAGGLRMKEYLLEMEKKQI